MHSRLIINFGMTIAADGEEDALPESVFAWLYRPGEPCRTETLESPRSGPMAMSPTWSPRLVGLGACPGRSDLPRGRRPASFPVPLPSRPEAATPEAAWQP